MSGPKQTTRRAKREPVQVAEVQKPDASLAQMKGIRQHRLNRAETELAESRRKAEQAREHMRSARRLVREAQTRADAFWKETLQSFRAMAITSGEIMLRRRQYEKLKEQARHERLRAGKAVDSCRAARQQVRQAHKAVVTRRKDSEKLALWTEGPAPA